MCGKIGHIFYHIRKEQHRIRDGNGVDLERLFAKLERLAPAKIFVNLDPNLPQPETQE